MAPLDSKERLKELYLPSAKDFVFVDVPELRYVMIDGEGNADGDEFTYAVKWVFAAVYPLKLIGRKRMGKNFVEPPLEGLWWADDMEDFIKGNKDKMKWRVMIVVADWVNDEMFEDAVAKGVTKKGKAPASLRLERLEEGKSVQIMHIGPPAKAASTLARLHGEFLPEHGMIPNGHHHEIYLNDPHRVAAEKLKTIFRQPVRSSTCGIPDASHAPDQGTGQRKRMGTD